LLLEINVGSGVIMGDDQVIVSLTGEQTALFAGLQEVAFDFVRTPDDTHLGIRVHVPISSSVTPA
jgi:hypothetical protein